MILDGKSIAADVRAEVREQVASFVQKYGRAPGLDVVLVGEDPASQVYTRNKEKASREVGMRGTLHLLPANATTAEVRATVDRLNADPLVDGILVQLPLPPTIDEAAVLDAVDPAKDVDGFHPVNAGLLASGRAGMVPCTPLGCMRLLKASNVKLYGARAVVVGRSNIVGKPIAQLLLAENATVTLAHSKTRDLPALCREADVLVAAVGRPEMIRGSWIKPGAVVIDVGINRVETGRSDHSQRQGQEPAKSRLVGDVAFDEAREHAGAITPVPGGVGPLTIAYLLSNTVRAAEARNAKFAKRA